MGKRGKVLGVMASLMTFKEFQGLVTPIMCRVFNKILETGTWPNLAIISVVRKEGKDPENCSSHTVGQYHC